VKFLLVAQSQLGGAGRTGASTGSLTHFRACAKLALRLSSIATRLRPPRKMSATDVISDQPYLEACRRPTSPSRRCSPGPTSSPLLCL